MFEPLNGTQQQDLQAPSHPDASRCLDSNTSSKSNRNYLVDQETKRLAHQEAKLKQAQLKKRFEMIQRGEDPFEPIVDLRVTIDFNHCQQKYAALELKNNKVISFKNVSALEHRTALQVEKETGRQMQASSLFVLKTRVKMNQELLVVTLNPHVEKTDDYVKGLKGDDDQKKADRPNLTRRLIESILGINQYDEVLTLPKIQEWKSSFKRSWYSQSKSLGLAYVPLNNNQCSICFKSLDHADEGSSFWTRFLNNLVCASKSRTQFWCFFCQEHHC